MEDLEALLRQGSLAFRYVAENMPEEVEDLDRLHATLKALTGGLPAIEQ